MWPINPEKIEPWTLLCDRITLCSPGLFEHDIRDIAQTVETMIDAGSRFKNMETRLGEGVALVLGTTMSESMWVHLPQIYS